MDSHLECGVIGPSLIGDRTAAVVPVQWHVADRVRTAGVSPSKRRHEERNRHGCRVQADISAFEPTRRHVAGFSDDGEPAAAAPALVKQWLRDKLTEHRAYITEHADDMLEIRNWRWGA